MVGRKIKLGCGDLTRVWKDSIDGLPPLNLRFPQLFEICTDQDCTVQKFDRVEASTFFRRRLCPNLRGQWDKLREHILGLKTTADKDVVFWGLSKNAKYSTKSMYKWLEKPLYGCNYRWIWEAKLPLKIQIFLWQMAQDAVLTRAVMKRKKWPGNPVCSFCNNVETASHLFFTCPVARVAWRAVGVVLGTDLCPNNTWQFYVWCNMFLPNGARFYTVGLAAVTWAIWLARNKATFEKQLIKSPSEIVFSACSFLLYWAGLQPVEEAARLRQGN